MTVIMVMAKGGNRSCRNCLIDQVTAQAPLPPHGLCRVGDDVAEGGVGGGFVSGVDQGRATPTPRPSLSEGGAWLQLIVRREGD